MIRNRSPSPLARTLLSVLAKADQTWSHGYDLCQLTGIKSGTLYPLLIRWEKQGYLEAQWQPPAGPGRPPRHAYRLSAEGHRFAREQAVAHPDLHRSAAKGVLA
jgi:PadR family transcriptional regulator, regulatory protein PadR